MTQKIQEYETKFLETIDDDLNMPLAMGVVWELIRNDVKSPIYFIKSRQKIENYILL